MIWRDDYDLKMKVNFLEVHISIRDWRVYGALQHNAVVWMWLARCRRANTHAHLIHGAMKGTLCRV